jgi:hypothetical protein
VLLCSFLLETFSKNRLRRWTTYHPSVAAIFGASSNDVASQGRQAYTCYSVAEVQVEPSFFAAGSMSADLTNKGCVFLRKRFLETWNITRTDITGDVIDRRLNLVMFDDDKIAGWLGIEDSGELANACVERGYAWRAALSPLILHALELDVKYSAFVFVPVEKPASAYIFLHSGMCLPVGENFCTKTLSYPERSILLAKLVRGGLTCVDTMSSVKIQTAMRLVKYGTARRDTEEMGTSEELGC